MPRAPGDIAIKRVSATNIVTYKSAIFGTSTQVIPVDLEFSNRPFYGKGARTKLGNTYWIYPTAYEHMSRVITQWNPSRVISKDPYGFTSEKSQSCPDIYNLIGANLGWGHPSMTSAYTYNVRSAAEVKALNKLADEKAQVGETLATYLQTVRMFTDKSKLLHTLLNAAKKGKLKEYLSDSAAYLAKNGDKVLASAYLEYVYGWKPLVSDIFGIHELLKEYSSGKIPVIVHGHGVQHMNTTRDFSLSGSDWRSAGLETTHLKGTCDLYARIDPEYTTFRVINQLGLLNPAGIIWAATPWSFIVDWFIPIGPVINAFTAPIGLNFISGTTAARCTRSYEGKFHSAMSGGTIILDEPCNFKAVDQLYDRETHVTFPLPTPYLNLNPFAGDRKFKALALAIMQLRR